MQQAPGLHLQRHKCNCNIKQTHERPPGHNRFCRDQQQVLCLGRHSLSSFHTKREVLCDHLHWWPYFTHSLAFQESHISYKPWTEPCFEGTFSKDLFLLLQKPGFNVAACCVLSGGAEGFPARWWAAQGKSHCKLTCCSQLGNTTAGKTSYRDVLEVLLLSYMPKAFCEMKTVYHRTSHQLNWALPYSSPEPLPSSLHMWYLEWRAGHQTPQLMLFSE